MSFRKIRPSSLSDSSSSASNPGQSTFTPKFRTSRARSVRGNIDPSNSTISSKRRRVPESVTRNACVTCKKARAKCDGKQPCKRCTSRLEASDCNYEIHVKYAKEELVKQIRDLRAKDHLTDQILQALSTDENVSGVVERLKNGETYESIVGWLEKSSIDDIEMVSPNSSNYSTFEPPGHETNGINSTGYPWTSVTSDTAILDHLFQLYFAWVHPVHTLFCEGHFVDSYKKQSEVYCSTLLVNAICAMACHLSSVTDSEEIDFEQLSMEFSDAVRATIDGDDTKITTIQALAVMFLVDSARADGLRAASYLKLAMDALPSIIHVEHSGFHESCQTTLRGIRNLNVEWSQMTFQVPATIDFISFDSNGDIGVENDDSSWYCYRYINDDCKAWPGFIATANREKSKLITIISDVATMMYSQNGPALTANHILQQYDRFLTWRHQLLAIFGNTKDSHIQTLPHVLSLLILFSNSVVQLLRPLLELDGFPRQRVDEVIWDHAQQGLLLLDEYYRNQYTCRHQQVLQMFGVLHLVDVIARFFPDRGVGSDKDGPKAVQLGLEVLIESQTGFPIAGQLQEMLRRSATNCSIPLPPESHTTISPPFTHPFYRMDDMVDACTRPTYVQPVSTINNKLTSTFSTDWASEAPSFGFRISDVGSSRLRNLSEEESRTQNFMQIPNLLNTS